VKPAPIGGPDPLVEEAPKLGLLDHIIPSRKRKVLAAAKQKFEHAQGEWSAEVSKIERSNAARLASYAKEVEEHAVRERSFLEAQAAQHESVNARAAASRAGEEDGVNELLDLALSRVSFPDWMNVNFEIDYAAEPNSCVIDFQLPSPDDIPTLKEVKYVQSRNEFNEKHATDAERNRIYDSVLYQIALLTIWALFRAETFGHLERVTFNGWVDYIDRATGMDERSCIMSVGVNRTDLDKIDLDRVDPKECFKLLKGVAASKLIGLAAVAPLERPRAADGRLIESREVAGGLDAGVNLAAMDWQEFEHLVRQVFEHEFSSSNSEVRVTQASRDGGVDAIVFDPDPIKGGKIVIQAKRYTNTVDVSAVRDLYGTVMNEGAIKGILVTTSQFGPDARKFAQGKPLSLIDGGNLLFLLERMGVAARINLREAKETLRAGS
jgi:restriction system protein